MTLATLQLSARRKVASTVTSAEYPDADVNYDLNEWYRTILSWVMLESGIWEFNANVSKTDFIGGQNEFVLPQSPQLIMLNRVELLYPGATNWVKAYRLDDKSTNDAFQNAAPSGVTVARPVYRVFDNSIFIYPAATTTVTGGIAIELSEDVTDLASAGDLPNLNPLIHKAMAVGAAYNYCSANELSAKANRLWIELFGRPTRSLDPSVEALKTQIEQLAAQRDQSERARFIPRNTSFN